MRRKWTPGCPCCGGGISLCVLVRGCGEVGYINGATVVLKKDGVTVGTAVSSSQLGQNGTACFDAPGPGDYTIIATHPDFPVESEAPYTLEESETTVFTKILMTPCGTLPETLHVSGTEGAEIEITLGPVDGFTGPYYTGSRFVATRGLKYDLIGGCSPDTADEDILCRVTYTLTCSGGGFQLNVSHNVGPGYTDTFGFHAGSSFFHSADSERDLSDPLHCPFNGTPESGDRGAAATDGDGTLICEPFQIEVDLDFDGFVGGVDVGVWSAEADGGTVPLIGGVQTFTITK